MKAILILDKFPSSCAECQLKVLDADLYYTTYACKNVDCETDDILETTKYEMHCPLKPLPQHKLTDLEKTTDYSCGWEQGYNACLDEILGGD